MKGVKIDVWLQDLVHLLKNRLECDAQITDYYIRETSLMSTLMVLCEKSV